MKITTQQEVRLAIFNKLKKITKTGYPYIYNIIQTQEGHQVVEQEILRFVSQYSTSLDSAISKLESNYAYIDSFLVKSTDLSEGQIH